MPTFLKTIDTELLSYQDAVHGGYYNFISASKKDILVADATANILNVLLVVLKQRFLRFINKAKSRSSLIITP